MLERSVSPGNAQIELSARDAATYPQWPTGSEPAIADASTVAVGTRHEMDGPVRILVDTDLGLRLTGAWRLVFEGVLASPSGRYRVGSGINGQLFDVPVSSPRVRVRVFVDPADEPTDVAFEIVPYRAIE